MDETTSALAQASAETSALEAWGLAVAILGLLVGSVAAVFAILSWRVSRSSRDIANSSLELSREQASRQAQFVVACRVKPSESEREPGLLVFVLANTGRVAAEDIHGWIHLQADKLEPWKPPPREPRPRRLGLIDVELPPLPQTPTLRAGGIYSIKTRSRRTAITRPKSTSTNACCQARRERSRSELGSTEAERPRLGTK